MYLEILDPKRKKFLSKLGFLKKYGFYMAGGTALALQIGHRTSLDFDFYTEKKFDARKLREQFDKKIKRVQEIYITEDTLGLDVNGIKMSFFRYSYRLIRPCVQIEDICLASKEDIAGMKILAISQRGKRRDFIDIYFLIKEFGLRKIMKFTKEKYSMFNIYVGLQGLVYFKDADEDSGKQRFKTLQKADWRGIKKYIVKEVNIIKGSL
ncbi:MAG: nucleotidyl transferase AbiEii/AbiGii toxin family protein [bacterium]|nr:nucleotidyl transferase AbiEii/AbiGii toxin family protein [bacterium]